MLTRTFLNPALKMHPPPFYSSVQKLKDTPPEIVHYVLDDLRLCDILKLASCNEKSLDYSIMSHPVCRKVFHDNFENLYSVREIFRFHQDVCRALRRPQAPSDSILSLGILSLPNAQKTLERYGDRHSEDENSLADYKVISRYILTRLENMLSIRPLQYAVLVPYAKQPENLYSHLYNASFSNLKVFWEEFQAMQKEANSLRTSQLRRAANLLEANPDILKQRNDPGQERRPNLQHILNRMNAAADRYSRLLISRDINHGSSYFRYLRFPVVPFDAALDFVAEMLVKKHGLTAQFKQLDLEESDKSKDLSPISNHVNTLLNGTKVKELPENEDSQPESESERKAPFWTLHAPSLTVSTDGSNSDAQSKPQKPFFTHIEGARQPETRPNTQLFMAWLPYHERELQWLEAFVQVYRYYDGHSEGVNAEG